MFKAPALVLASFCLIVGPAAAQRAAPITQGVTSSDLSQQVAQARQQSAQVRGALHGTMLRNNIYNFARLGTFIERADNTARILDVKYYVLLPSASSAPRSTMCNGKPSCARSRPAAAFAWNMARAAAPARSRNS